MSVLGADGSSGASPTPDVEDIPALIEQFRRAGMDVRYDFVGTLDPVSSAAGSGLYRVVQESLANVAQHQPGTAASVLLDTSGRDVHLQVCNAASEIADEAGDEQGPGSRGCGSVQTSSVEPSRRGTTTADGWSP